MAPQKLCEYIVINKIKGYIIYSIRALLVIKLVQSSCNLYHKYKHDYLQVHDYILTRNICIHACIRRDTYLGAPTPVDLTVTD